ncbi:ABC transporter permease [Pseudomonas fluorescens]|uniref:ABC transporter permease n=1 Tax=Pseudomonas fluorescens TaxID=294 RepID=UPI0019063429|nr:ABC transporter permease [Pseudomonas fluorescens]MBD8090452.1 ABC transporter permease [Pseudomonas fluorescens]MBD8717863.1 ABC transporter permease [Pseudomonas fluorescens]
MNPHAPQPISIWALLRSLWVNRQLIGQMTKREVIGRYKGSFLGLGWSFLNPLLMLAVYTFVFSVVFRSRWGMAENGVEESKAMFAVVLFIGMIVYGLFAEILNRAPGLIVGNVNYVKKVVFPLEILPVVAACAALFHALVSLTVWLFAYSILIDMPDWNMLYLPLVLFPLLVLALGLAWFLASLGVFLRDVGQTVTIITTMMMFLAPVFFPVKNLPLEFQPLIMANPLTFIIEQARDVLIWGKAPDFMGLFQYLLIALVVFWAGFVWFQKMRKGFSDVL